MIDSFPLSLPLSLSTAKSIGVDFDEFFLLYGIWYERIQVSKKEKSKQNRRSSRYGAARGSFNGDFGNGLIQTSHSSAAGGAHELGSICSNFMTFASGDIVHAAFNRLLSEEA